MILPDSPFYTERKHRSYRDRFTMIWMVNRECNFQCAYCYGTHEVADEFNVDEFIEKLKTVPQPFRITLTGGEPMLKPWIIEVCQKVGEIGGKVELQTNMSLQFPDFADQASPEYVEIIETSFHPQARLLWGGDKALDDYVENFLHAQEKGFKTTTWMIDDPRIPADEFMKWAEWLYDRGIVPMRKRYCGDEGGGQPGDALFVQGKTCSAGCGGVSLWENFDMSPCDHDRTVLGNLFTGFELYPEPRPCDKPFCGCLGRELLVEPVYDEYYKKEFGG